MAFTNKLIDLIGILMTLMVLTLPSTTANIDCNGKPFHCVNSTHFMICVDLGSGVSSTLDDFVLQCPPPTVCHSSNKFECDFPAITSTDAPTMASTLASVSETETVTKPNDLTTSVPYEHYFDTTLTLSDNVLITHQTTVTETTIKVGTDVTQNNEVITSQSELNGTVPSVELQNDFTLTTPLPNDRNSNTTVTIPNDVINDNVTIPITKSNSTMTDYTDIITTTILPTNTSTSDLDLFPVNTEEVKIVTHESITNSTLNQSIQGATENSTVRNILSTLNNTDLPSYTTETSPSLDGILNVVTISQPLNISANITDINNNITENINITVPEFVINFTIIETDPSTAEGLVPTVISNIGINSTELITDSTGNFTWATKDHNLNKTIHSEINVTQNEHTLLPATALPNIIDLTTEFLIYNGTETTIQNNLTKLSANSSATNIFPEVTEKVNTINQTTPVVDLLQSEIKTNNMSNNIEGLILNTPRTIEMTNPDFIIQNVTETAETESTLLLISNSTLVTSSGSDAITEPILSEVTKSTVDEININTSTVLPIDTTTTTTESTLKIISETTPKVEVYNITTTLLPDDNVSTKDSTLMLSESNGIDFTLNKTTTTLQTHPVQNEYALMSNLSNNTLLNYEAETATVVTEIPPSAPTNKIILHTNVSQENVTSPLSLKINELAVNYTPNANISSLDGRQIDNTTPLPSINTETVLFTDATENKNNVSFKSSVLNETTQNEILSFLNKTTSINTTPSTKEEQVLRNTTGPYHEQPNSAMPVSEYFTTNPTELILVSETNVSETNRGENDVKNYTTSVTDSSITVTDLVIDKPTSVTVLKPETSMTLNETSPSSAHADYNTLLNSNTHTQTVSKLKNVSETTTSFPIHHEQDYLRTSRTSNTTVPDNLVDMVTKLPVSDITDDTNVVTAGYNTTFRTSANSSNSSQTLNEKKIKSENIVSDDITQSYAQNNTDLSMKTTPTQTDNILILSSDKENHTLEVSMTSYFTEPVTESYNGSSQTSLVNVSTTENNTIKITKVIKHDMDPISYKNNDNASQVEIHRETNKQQETTAYDTNSFQTTTENTNIINVRDQNQTKGIPATIPMTAPQTTISSLSVDNVQLTTDHTISPDTTGNFMITNIVDSISTVQKETSDIAVSENITSLLQTEPLTIKTTTDASQQAPKLIESAFITNPVDAISVTTTVTEYAPIDSIPKALTELSAVNIVVESTTQTNTILLFNSSLEQIHGGQSSTAATVLLSKSPQVNPTVSMSPESITETSINTNVTPDVIHINKAINTIIDQIAVNISSERNDPMQNINKTTATGIKQDTDLGKSNLPIPQNLTSQNQNKLNDIRGSTLLDNLRNTPQLPLTTPPTLAQTNYIKVGNPINNSEAQQTNNYSLANSDAIKVYTVTEIDNVDKANSINFGGNNSKLDAIFNISVSQSKENETIIPLNVTNYETSHAHNDSLASTARAPLINLEQQNYTSKQLITDNLTSKPLKYGWQTEATTEYYIREDKVTSDQYITDKLRENTLTKAFQEKVSTEPLIPDNKITLKQIITDNVTSKPLAGGWQAELATDHHIGEDKVTSDQYITDKLRNNPLTEASKAVTVPVKGDNKVLSKQYTTENIIINPSTESSQTQVITEPQIGGGNVKVTSDQYITDKLGNNPLPEASKAVTAPDIGDNKVPSKQYITENITINPSTESSQTQVVTEPQIGVGNVKVTSDQYITDKLGNNPLTEASKSVTAYDIGDNKVPSKQYITENITMNPLTESSQTQVVTEPQIGVGNVKVTSDQYITDKLRSNPLTEASKAVTTLDIGDNKVPSKQYISENKTMNPLTESSQTQVVTEPQIGVGNVKVTSDQYITDKLGNNPLTEVSKSVTSPDNKVPSKQFIIENITINPSTESSQSQVVTEPQIGASNVISKQFIADSSITKHSTEVWRVEAVTESYISEDKVTLKQYTTDSLTKKSATATWGGKVVTEPHIGEDKATSKPYVAQNLSTRSSTAEWRGQVVTEPLIGEEEKVSERQYLAATSTVGPSTEFPLQETVVAKAHIDQYKVTSTQGFDIPTPRPLTEPLRGKLIPKPISTPVIDIEPPEFGGKLSAMSAVHETNNKPNDDRTIISNPVTKPSEEERLMVDLKTVTDAFLIKEPQLGEKANKTNLYNLQPNYTPNSKSKIVNKPKPSITQTTSDTDIDTSVIMTQAVKTGNEWLIKKPKTSVNVGITPPYQIKGDQSEHDDIESVEKSEVNEEQAEYEEHVKEKREEALENSRDKQKVSPKTRKMSPVYDHVNNDSITTNRNKITLESTIEMTTEKVEKESISHHEFKTNVEIKPTIATAHLEPTKASLVFAPAKRNYVCKINSRGKFPDMNDCRKFYICSGKPEPIEGLCPINTVFSDLRKQCTKNVSHCIRNNQFQCVREGRFTDYFSDNIYYICQKNNMNTFTRFKLQCLNGYHLNKTSVRCALNTKSGRSTSQQSISDVSYNSEQSVPSPKNEKLVMESSNKFKCVKEGKFPDPNNCRKYYVCSKKSGKTRYRLKRKKCDSDELYHKDKKKCVDADSYDCN